MKGGTVLASHRPRHPTLRNGRCRARAPAHNGIPRYVQAGRILDGGAVAAFLLVDDGDGDGDGGGAATPFETSPEGTPTPWRTTRLPYTRDLRPSSPDNYWTIHMDETNINDVNSGSDEPLCDAAGRDFVASSDAGGGGVWEQARRRGVLRYGGFVKRGFMW